MTLTAGPAGPPAATDGALHGAPAGGAPAAADMVQGGLAETLPDDPGPDVLGPDSGPEDAAAGEQDRAPAIRVAKKRTRPQSEDDITTASQRVRAVLTDPAVYLVSRAFPIREKRSPGRPGDYPHWTYTLLNALVAVCGSAREAVAELADDRTWADAVATAREVLGEEAADLALPIGPARWHWNEWKRTYGQMYVAPLGAAFRDAALAQARGQGLLDPDEPGTLAAPGRGRTVAGDGKVMNSPCRNLTAEHADPVTGRIRRRRHDRASGTWNEGGGGRVHGSKFVTLAARSDDYYGRVVLDVEHLPPVKGQGGEAGLAVAMILRLQAAAGPGLAGVVWDGALSGVHIDRLARHGLLVVSPVKAKSNPDGKRKGPDRVEKDARLGEYEGPDGCTHVLHAVGGRVHEKTVVEDGTPALTPLPFRLLPRRNRDGTWRHYHQVRIPCDDAPAGHHTTVVPVTGTAKDRKRGFNRSEHLRQVPPGTEQYDHLYGRRDDSESLNSQLERAFYFNRLPSYGAAAQTLTMIGAAMAENAVSRYNHHKRHHRRPRHERLAAAAPPSGTAPPGAQTAA